MGKYKNKDCSRLQIGININKITTQNYTVERVRLKRIINKFLVIDIFCYAHCKSRSFSQFLHRTSRTLRNFSRSLDVYLYFRDNPWREHLVIDKYGPPLTFDPAMPDKDLDFCVYSNREFLTTLGIAANHSHQVTINIYFPKWEGDETVS